jgi:two-component system OmpR family sensor kinase
VTLRTRLLLTSALVIGLVVLGVFAVLGTQRTFLTNQVDRQLRSAQPFFRGPPPEFGSAVDESPPASRDAPISSLYVGFVGADGTLEPVLEGQLLEDVPDVDVEELEAEVTGEAALLLTAGGREGNTQFRVMVRRSETGILSVTALPLDEVNSALNRLAWTLGGGTAVIAGVLLLAVWWVERLGLRPIATLTATADLISQGDRSHRVLDADPRTEAGKLASAFNVMLDERDETEARLRRFIADASHELRTPLTSISGYLDLYREGGFRNGSGLDDMVRRMSQESTRMHDLVEDLLLLANLDQHRPLRQEQVDVGRLLEDAATDARVLQPTRSISVDVTGSEPVAAIGDAFRLQQVVGALVGNALAYTVATSPLLLGARRTTRGIEIVVQDHGPGLTASQAAQVFDRFYRGEQSRSRRSGGSGLGLSIAKSIVEAHGGTITLHTAPGQGCRFTIALPTPPRCAWAAPERSEPQPTPLAQPT